jgi:phospholipid/cholesterol/gamma-HCH transport system substrate-binding protein
MRREVKIGIFLAGAIFIMAVLIFIVGDLSVLFKKGGYELSAYFDSAIGLENRASVRMAGVKIGYVRDIRLAERKAQVVMNISPEFQVPKGSKATLASLGLIGEKYIEISPSDAPDFFQAGEALQATPAISFDQLGGLVLSIGEKIEDVSRSLREITGEESQTNVRETLQNLNSFSGELNKFFADNKDDLRAGIQKASQTVQSFDARIEMVTKNLDDTIRLVREIAQENRGSIRSNIDKIEELFSQVEESLRLLQNSLEKISRGEGTLGKLVQNPQLYDEAESTLRAVNRTVEPFSQVQAIGNFRVDYLGDSDKIKSYLTVGFSLARRYFVVGQVVEDPFLEKFTYSAQGGFRWGAFASRAGLIESEFGAGIDLWALRDRLIFSLEGYDFSRDGGPHFRFLTRFVLFKYFQLVAGWDDFGRSASREFYFGFGLGTK